MTLLAADSAFRGSARSSRGTPAWTYLVAIAVPCAFLLALAIQPYSPLDVLLLDPVTVAGGKFHYGFGSNVGILIWCSTSAICLFSAAVLFGNPGLRRFSWFLAYAGLFTSLLLLDDFFLLHEEALPQLTGLPETVPFVLYGVLMLVYLAAFSKTILMLDYPIMIASLGFLAFGLAVDVFLQPDGSIWHRLGEDGTKLIGITAWAVFHIRASWLLVSGAGFHRT